ncbi:MAG: hypothetical protein RMJ17_01050 [Candidatus Aenigmarchaeota archaeon]|nr:hypothetical protein [Candidatus Aenigmarchaeota archaeon]MDW8149173.1 hypothetical protein [Candidatus Aenigmarchaeota archaeon]
MPIFGKKEDKRGRGVIPVDRVKDLSSKGFSEPEIIDILRREGYSPEEIDKAFTQTIKTAVEGKEEVKQETTTTSITPSSPTTSLPTLKELESIFEAKPKTMETLEVPETSLPSSTRALSEEYIEYIIDQKLIEVYQRFEDIYYRIEEIEKSMKEMNNNISNLARKKLIEGEELGKKFESFSENIQTITGRVSSLEKAFKETLPSLVEAIRSLNESLRRSR